MRIISKLHDYYDSASSLGVDQTIVYARIPETLQHGENKIWSRRYTTYFHNGYIGFCGKIYPILYTFHPLGYSAVEWTDFYGYKHWGKDGKKTVLFNLEAVDKYIEEYCKESSRDYADHNGRIEKDRFYANYHNKHTKDYLYRSDMRSEIKKFFIEEEISQPYKDLFQKHNVPLFVVDYQAGRTILNTLLKFWEFYKIFDAFTAFQELQMYVSGVLNGPTMPIPPVSDEDLAEAKGFDKWSFRKMPSASKKKGGKAT